MGTRPGHVEVTNTERDTKKLRMVYKTEDGKAPKPGEDGTTPTVDTFVLYLGSSDDDNAEIREHNAACKRDGKVKDMVAEPTVQVPTWALAHYRKLPLFQRWEESSALRISRAA